MTKKHGIAHGTQKDCAHNDAQQIDSDIACAICGVNSGRNQANETNHWRHKI